MAPAMMCVFDKVQSPIARQIFVYVLFASLEYAFHSPPIKLFKNKLSNYLKRKNLVIWKHLKLINQIVSEKLS